MPAKWDPGEKRAKYDSKDAAESGDPRRPLDGTPSANRSLPRRLRLVSVGTNLMPW